MAVATVPGPVSHGQAVCGIAIGLRRRRRMSEDLRPELPNGTNGSEKGSDCKKKPAFGLMTSLEEVGRTTDEKQNFLR